MEFQVKYYDNSIKIENFGIISEGELQGHYSYEIISEIKQVSKNGKNWLDNPGYNEDQIIENFKNKIRPQRDDKLKNQCDPEVAKAFWNKKSPDDLKDWQDYRLELLDIPENISTIDDVINFQWPDVPIPTGITNIALYTQINSKT